MKTDVTTYGSFLQSQARGAKPVGPVQNQDSQTPLVGGKNPLPGSGPDYKLDISNGSLPSPSSVSVPNLSPSLPKLDASPAKETAPAPKDEVVDKIKEEVKEAATKEVKKAEVTEEKSGTLKRPAIVFIKGLDIFSSPLKSETGYAGMGKIAESVEGSRLYGWRQKDEIIEEILKRDKSQPIVLVGHSFGGDTAVEIANELDSLKHEFRPVDLLITIDAVGFNNDVIPQNVKKHLNVFGENNFFLNDGPHVARRPEKTEVINMLSPLDHTELDDDKEIQYEVVSLIRQTLDGAS